MATTSGYVYGHTQGAGRETVKVYVYQMLVAGKGIKRDFTIPQSRSMERYLREIVSDLGVSWDDEDIVVVTSPPSGCEPCWLEHAHIDPKMPLRLLDFDWFSWIREAETDGRLGLTILLYRRAFLHAWYDFHASRAEASPLFPLVLRDELLLLPFTDGDNASRTPSPEEFEAAHDTIRKMMGDAADKTDNSVAGDAEQPGDAPVTEGDQEDTRAGDRALTAARNAEPEDAAASAAPEGSGEAETPNAGDA